MNKILISLCVIGSVFGIAFTSGYFVAKQKYDIPKGYIANAECNRMMISLGVEFDKFADKCQAEYTRQEAIIKALEGPCNANINIISKLRIENAELKKQLENKTR